MEHHRTGREQGDGQDTAQIVGSDTLRQPRAEQCGRRA
jgi:hypothetical protein